MFPVYIKKHKIENRKFNHSIYLGKSKIVTGIEDGADAELIYRVVKLTVNKIKKLK